MTEKTRFGLFVYNYPAEEVLALAEYAEELGFSSLWLGEHFVWPVGYGSHHPSGDRIAEKSAPKVGADSELTDPVVLLGALSARTERIVLGTGVFLATARHPLLTARAIATAQAIMGDRLRFGVGAGWLPEEFEALDVPFRGRGARLDEAIEIMQLAWRGGPFSHSGKHWNFDSVQVCPRQVDVRLVIGGNSSRALDRAVATGTGWLSSGRSSLPFLIDTRRALHDRLLSVGRAVDEFETWVRPDQFAPIVTAEYHALGFVDQVFPGEIVWPRGPQPLDEKREHMRAWAAAFGV